jgi:heptosyltransferase-3
VPNPKENILIYRLGSLGDTIVALPCFHLVARSFENSLRIVLTNSPVHSKAPAASAILQGSGLVHEYLNYSVGTRNVISLVKLFWKIRRLKVNTMVYLTPPRGALATWRDEVFFRICGVRKIIGIPRGELASHRYDAVTDRYEAEASRLARCLAPIGDARLNDPASWDLFLTDKERECANSALRPLHGITFLALGIASKKNVTDWGIGNWKELMPLLRSKFPGHAVVFVGAREDRSAIDEVAAHWSGKLLNLSGDLSPRESAAVIKQADLFLGVDSGPMHLAASVGTVCVTIFAAHKEPGTWFPYGDSHESIYHKTDCYGCNLETCTIEKKKCILSISAAEVVAATVRAAARKREQSATHQPPPMS